MPIRSCSPSATYILPSVSISHQNCPNDRKHPKRCSKHYSVSLKPSLPLSPGPTKIPHRSGPRLGFDSEVSDLANGEDSHLSAEKWFERSNRNATGNRVVSLPNSKR